MTDPLDDLKAALKAAPPSPDPARKTAALQRAAQIFDENLQSRQGSANQTRLTPDRPTKRAGLFTGVTRMFASLTSRPALTASTALVAVGLVALVPILREGPPGLPGTSITELTDGLEQENRADLGASDEEMVIVEAEPVMVEPMVMAEQAPARPETYSAKVATRDRRVQNAPIGNLSGIELSEATQQLLNGGNVETEFHADADVTFTLSGESDHGLRFGTTIDLDDVQSAEPNTETFANEAPNPVKIAAQEPVSTFSIDVDTASYSVIRSLLMNGYLPDPASVRIEEMINYFPYAYAAPAPGEGAFKPTVTVAPTPWNVDTQLLHIALQGEKPNVADRPLLNLVFLIDIFGSMN